MAIRGIDTQIMITNTAEYQKDASVQQKKNNLTQDYQAVMTKAAEAEEQQTVTTSAEVQEANVKHDKDNDNDQGGSQSGKHRKKEETREEYPDPNLRLLDQLRTDHMYTIDIQV